MHPLDISSDQFRRLAEHVTRLAADYLQSLDSRSISPGSSGKEIEALFHTELPETGLGENALSGLQNIIKHSRAQNGRFFGYVLGSGEPVGATADLLASVLNQNVTLGGPRQRLLQSREQLWAGWRRRSAANTSSEVSQAEGRPQI